MDTAKEVSLGRIPLSNVNWTNREQIALAHRDGLVMALVPESHNLDTALKILLAEMRKHEPREPGISGELIVRPETAATDIVEWADEQDLANRRVGLHLVDEDLPLQEVAEKRLNQYLRALEWARASLGYTSQRQV